MDEQMCPRCKTTKYRNPSLKLMVNVCGHTLCDNCVELLFVRGAGTCPECKTPLRRNQFRVQLFEDSIIEKEVDIRRRVMKDFNKQEGDFQTLREYNDYLEDIEHIVYNLTNGVDMEATRKKIENYRRENKELITKNRQMKSHDMMYLDALLEEEQQIKEERKQEYKFLEKQSLNQKKRNKEALLDELIYSDRPADQVIASHVSIQQNQEAPTYKAPPKKAIEVSSGARLGVGFQDNFLPIPKIEEIPYEYMEVEVYTFGPEAPSTQEELTSNGYVRHIRSASPSGVGGGYKEHMACQRAVEEAFSGLFFFPFRHNKHIDPLGIETS
ncbi:CDK-activating kinase assembly factor MAT1-like [Lytechinus pictus]|uniref:CDK-activating kinase assembly factor MAT1-like n=1 Tax=Lytechinus pictus TaxID=7653 RepID=UPI00240E8747|nr:CDK-activating kinase assembly factor MAT1-like [Lytechinus pictus]XP_054759629.1 CDK-activating kinase assembly factor MAT1-like [Lytechinus pictus]